MDKEKGNRVTADKIKRCHQTLEDGKWVEGSNRQRRHQKAVHLHGDAAEKQGPGRAWEHGVPVKDHGETPGSHSARCRPCQPWQDTQCFIAGALDPGELQCGDTWDTGQGEAPA